ncbi:MAG TPA: nuclear transport factor 2 family protein [Acidimicrobiales bacterium]|jgi:hypothetical protein|nr:nuclear transport factor 2 family protein [Acidimicrobiales bacterium]
MATPDGTGPERRSDAEELRSLSTAYASAADDRDGERFAALFLDSGELVVAVGPGEARPASHHVGHEALRRVPDGLRRYERTFHQVSNHRFAIQGDRAKGEVLCVAHHVLTTTAEGAGEPGLDTVWFIRYLDRYVRTDGGWRFERRSLYLQWVEEHPVSVLPTGAQTERLDPSPGLGSDSHHTRP